MTLPACRAAVINTVTAFLSPRLGMQEGEFCGRPPGYCMAVGTIPAKRARMEGWVRMASGATCGKPGKHAAFMALIAFDARVTAVQREVHAAMIETGHIIPVFRIMASGTIRAVFAVMFVVLLMA